MSCMFWWIRHRREKVGLCLDPSFKQCVQSTIEDCSVCVLQDTQVAMGAVMI